jgi:outer membrane protein assembly factor BamB
MSSQAVRKSWNPAARALTVAAMALACVASPARADDNWPRFRGPNGSGVSDDPFPVRITDKDIAWKAELPGIGHSSPVVWGKRVFVTAADEEAGKRLLLCLDAGDGSMLWQHDVDLEAFKKHGENSYASSTPALDARRAYVQWTTPEHFAVVAVNHDGTEAWRVDLGAYKTQHGGGGSPVVYGDMVIVNVDQDQPGSFVAALDCATGKVRWRTPRASKNFSTSTPCVYRGADGREQLIVTTNANGFTALDPATGAVVWELPGAFKDRVVSSPVVAAGRVIGACGEGGRGKGVVAVKPPVTVDEKPDVAYTLTDEVPYVPSPIAFRDRLFTWSDSGTVICGDAASGEEIWRGKVKGGFFGSPVCAAGRLYCLSKRGEVVVVDAAADEFKELGRSDLKEASHATPAIAAGRMYLRTIGHVVCVKGESKPAAVGRTEP